MMLRDNFAYFLVVGLVIVMTACSSSKRIDKNYVYFSEGSDTLLPATADIKLRTTDILKISVYSGTANQEQAAIFNTFNLADSQANGYQIDANGNIDFPKVGAVHAEGFSLAELENILLEKVRPFVKDPIVRIEYLDFTINVMGEVKSPGSKKYKEEKVTIFDALSDAGDLTDFGRREDVTVVRDEHGKKVFYKLDLRDKNSFQSPAYLLLPNDIVYVSPNKYKLKNLSVDPEKQRRTGIFFTVVSAVISVATLFVFYFRN